MVTSGTDGWGWGWGKRVEGCAKGTTGPSEKIRYDMIYNSTASSYLSL